MEQESQLNRELCLMRHSANCLKHTDWARVEHHDGAIEGIASLLRPL